MTTEPPDGFFSVHERDARRLSRLLEPYSNRDEPLLTCTITSPPYGSLKNYGHPDQIGWGQPYEEYLIELRRVFRAVGQHTRSDGSMWVIADTLRPEDNDAANARMPQRLDPLPFRMAGEAAESGWILRESLIWKKDKTLPWSSGNRFRNTFEYVLLFVRGPKYKFYIDRLRDPTQLEEWWVRWPERYNPLGKAPDNVWDIPIPVQGSWKTSAVQHACPLPPDLVERLIYLSTDPGDVVFDPFAGTGVVVAEAERLGRRGLGVELNRDYVRAFTRSVRPEIMKRNNHDQITARMEGAEHVRRTIPRLRALKYPKVLVQQLARERDLPRLRLVVAVIGKQTDRTMVDADHPLNLHLVLAANGENDDLEALRAALKLIIDRPPASKFGLVPSIDVCRPAEVDQFISRKRFYLYMQGRTWDATRIAKSSEFGSLAATEGPRRTGDYAYPPILSNVEVHETPNED